MNYESAVSFCSPARPAARGVLSVKISYRREVKTNCSGLAYKGGADRRGDPPCPP